MKLAAPRLLPIVIAATAALLLFKGIGIVTQGGYVLVGTETAIAAGGGSKKAPAEGGGEKPAEEGAGAGGASMTDQSPTLEDKAVTMELPSGEASAAAGEGEGEPAGAEAGAETPEVGPSEDAALAACPPTGGAAEPGAEAAPGTAAEGAAEAEPAAGEGATEESSSVGPCTPDPGVNEYGDALPLIKDSSTGALVPLADTLKDASSENAITERLAERRTELETREKELDMRSTLLDAAEKRLEERSAELKALEEKIGKMVDDNKTAEQQQFVSLVAMYENMKPKDAATIFNQLDMPVLLGVAKAMNPRKMAPILAKMDPLKAKALTDGIAAEEAPEPATTEAAAEDLTNLPQIVGQ